MKKFMIFGILLPSVAFAKINNNAQSAIQEQLYEFCMDISAGSIEDDKSDPHYDDIKKSMSNVCKDVAKCLVNRMDYPMEFYSPQWFEVNFVTCGTKAMEKEEARVKEIKSK